MKNKARIYWQVNDGNEHDIPERAVVKFEIVEGDISIWIDKEDQLYMKSSTPFDLKGNKK